eukprot:tig00020560_g11089.t1
MSIKVGLIGAGRIGRVHAETLAAVPFADLAVVSDVIEAACKKLAEDFRIPKYTTDYKEILNDPSIKAVWVCSPSDTHAQIIKEAAQKGKHLFVEKPIATDLAGVDEALGVVKQCGVKLFLAFQRRFDPNFARIKKGVVAGEAGNVISVRLTSRDPGPPPVEYTMQSGGIFKDMAIHDFDMSRFLTGSEPVEIMAVASNLVDPRIKDLAAPLCFDTALTTIRFENGATVTVDNCRKAVYGYDQRAEVFGTAGALMSDNNFASNVHHWGADKLKRDLPLNFFMDRYTEAYKNETISFLNSLVKDAPVECSGDDGRKALVMAMAAAKSAAEHRWVKISEITPNSH